MLSRLKSTMRLSITIYLIINVQILGILAAKDDNNLLVNNLSNVTDTSIKQTSEFVSTVQPLFDHLQNETNDTVNELIGNELKTTTTKILLNTETAHTNNGVLPDITKCGAKSAVQPIYTEATRIRKCCPPGQAYTQIAGIISCAESHFKLNIEIEQIEFYDGCLVSDVFNKTIDYDVGNLCSRHVTSLVYSEKTGDQLHIMQNGSLLVVYKNSDGYDVFVDDYCLDFDENGVMQAIVCDVNFDIVTITKAESRIYAGFMFISVPLLLITGVLYLWVPKLRLLHGRSLALHSICLGIGFCLLGFSQLKVSISKTTGYIVQYFIIACFCWMLTLCVDVCLHTWFYLPRGVRISGVREYVHFACEFVFAMGFPLIMVLLAKLKGYPGTPSYYLKGLSEDTRSSQSYFIPPICIMLAICFILLIAIYFGFRELDKIARTAFMARNSISSPYGQPLTKLNNAHLQDVKRFTKSTCILYAIMSFNWILEIVTFYVSDVSALIMFDIINALQGVVIFIIFVYLEYPRKVIIEWWKDRGSFDVRENEVDDQEMAPLKKDAIKM